MFACLIPNKFILGLCSETPCRIHLCLSQKPRAGSSQVALQCFASPCHFLPSFLAGRRANTEEELWNTQKKRPKAIEKSFECVGMWVGFPIYYICVTAIWEIHLFMETDNISRNNMLLVCCFSPFEGHVLEKETTFTCFGLCFGQYSQLLLSWRNFVSHLWSCCPLQLHPQDTVVIHEFSISHCQYQSPAPAEQARPHFRNWRHNQIAMLL